MRENELIAALILAIKYGLSSRGLTGVSVKQSFQPTQQGANSNPTVYLTKVSDKRHGHPQKKDSYDADASIMRHTEAQVYETAFQINAWCAQSTDVNALTASDLLSTTSDILQSDTAITSLKNAGVGVLRVTDLISTPFIDDRGQHEKNASFDIKVLHETVAITASEVAQKIEINFNRV